MEQFTHGGKSFNDIIRTANIATRFLADPANAHMLSASTFKFSDLKQRVATVYLCQNLDFLDVSRNMSRLYVQCAISEFQRPDIKKKVPVFMLCDEAFQYGYMKSIEAAYGAVRGAGVRLCTIWTDLAQMQERYGVMAHSILANSGAVIMMGSSDDQTAQHISAQCGMSTMITATPNISVNAGGPQVSWSKHFNQQPLLPAHMVMQLPADRMLVFVRGFGPALVKKIPYFKTWLKWRAGKNPYAPKMRILSKIFGR